MRNKPSENFRANFQAVRRDLGLSLVEIARRSGTNQATLSRILAGREKVTLERGERLAEALGVEFPDLLRDFPEKVSAL